MDAFWHSEDHCDKSRAQQSQGVVLLWVEGLQSRWNLHKASSQPTIWVIPPLLSRSEGARLEVSHSRRCSGAAPKAAVTHAGQKEFWNWSTALTASTKAAALLGNTKHLRYPLMHWAAPKLPRGHAQKVRKALRVSKLHQLEFQSWLTYFC